MTTSPSGKIDNNGIAKDYVAKMKEEVAEAEKLIEELKYDAGWIGWEKGQLEQDENSYHPRRNSGQESRDDRLNDDRNTLKKYTDDQKAVEAKLNALDPSFKSLDAGIAAIESGLARLSADGIDGNSEDSQMFSEFLDKVCDAALEKFETNEWKKKMTRDGDNDKDLLEDAMHAIKSSSKEEGDLSSLQDDMSKDLVKLNKEKNDAESDLKSIHWYNNIFGQKDGQKARDKAAIRNAEDMEKTINELMGVIGPQLADAENEIYAMADLAMDKIIDRLKKVLENPNLSGAQKVNKIKVLMALALGILSMIQSDAAQEKSKDQQTQTKATTYAVSMNISDEQASLKQLEEELQYAKVMGTIMKIAKPLIEVAGCLLAPGVGSFLVMALFVILDEAGLTSKLTNDLANTALGKTGAEALVGAFEVIATVGGGAALDEVMATAAAEVAEVVVEEVATSVARIIEETTAKAVAAAGKTGDEAATAAVQEVVSEAVNGAVKASVEKTVEQFSKQASATLIPQLLSKGTVSLSKAIATAALDNCIIAAKDAATTAAEKITFFAEAAAKGADVLPAQIAEVSNTAANTAVAKITDSTADRVASSTEKSATSKAISRGGWTAAFNALNDGAASYGVEQALLKSGQKKDSDDFKKIMMIMKIIESILASLVMMQGTGMLESTIMKGSSTTLLKLGTGVGIAGTGAQAVSLGGQADVSTQQSHTVKALNEEKVSNNTLQTMLQQYQAQAKVDAKHARDQFAEQASNYKMISQLQNNAKELSKILAEQAV